MNELKNPNIEAFTVGNLRLTPYTLSIHLLTKIMKIGVLGEEDIQEMTLVSSTSKFDGNFNLENYLDWVQAIERIFELKEYYDEKALNCPFLR